MRRNRILAPLLAGAVLAAIPSPARAWVAAYGGYHGGVAVGVRPPCCYGGAAVAGAAVAGAAIGAAAASAAYAPAPVYVAPAPVAYAPPVGTVVYSLPGGCANLSINGLPYMQCGGTFYQPFYSGGSLMYRVATP